MSRKPDRVVLAESRPHPGLLTRQVLDSPARSWFPLLLLLRRPIMSPAHSAAESRLMALSVRRTDCRPSPAPPPSSQERCLDAGHDGRSGEDVLWGKAVAPAAAR